MQGSHLTPGETSESGEVVTDSFTLLLREREELLDKHCRVLNSTATFFMSASSWVSLRVNYI